MRSNLITIYRYASPRTGKDYDSKLIDKRQLKFYLKRGYFETPPPKKVKDKGNDEEKKKEPESKKNLKFEDFSNLEKENIQRDKRPMAKLAEIHNTTYYVIRKIKGKS